MAGWAVVMTKPNCEKIAVANLTDQGFDCYAPRYRQVRPDGAVLIKPLFPRYIFSYIVRSWYSIRGTRGVSYLLLGDEGPGFVPQRIIDQLKARETHDGFIAMSEERIERFKKGDKLRATEGPFMDQVLTYDGVTPHDRVRALISMLGRECPVYLDEKVLVAA